MNQTGRTLGAEEPAGSAYGDIAAVVPLAIGAVAIWFATGSVGFLLPSLTLFWGGAVLAFFAGVYRGAAPRGGAAGSLAAVIWLFATGFAGLIGALWAYPMLATAAEMFGYVGLLVLGLASRANASGGHRSSGRPQAIAAAVAILSLVSVAAFVYASPLV